LTTRSSSSKSPGSEERDRGEKASAYMRLASLKHVCFIDRDRVRIDIFDRIGTGWLPRPPIEGGEFRARCDRLLDARGRCLCGRACERARLKRRAQ